MGCAESSIGVCSLHLQRRLVKGARRPSVPIGHRCLRSATCWEAVPGSSAKRLRAEESGFANLDSDGRLTKTALSGSVVWKPPRWLESASARARSIVGFPKPSMTGLRIASAATPVLPTLLRKVRQHRRTVVSDSSADLDRCQHVPASRDYGKLRQICDTQLNLGGDMIHKPIGPFAVMCVTEAEQPSGKGIRLVTCQS